MGDIFSADTPAMSAVLRRVSALENKIAGTRFTYNTPSGYDTSSISDRYRVELRLLVNSFKRALNDKIWELIRAENYAKQMLQRYLEEGVLDPDTDIMDPDALLVAFIGNSFYYYEAFPELVDGFLNDINVDTAISSRLQLKDHEKLLEAAEAEDKELFIKLFAEYIYKNVGSDYKKKITQYMRENSDFYDRIYEQYHKTAKSGHDATVIECMSMEDEDLEALKKMIEREKKNNKDVNLILDVYFIDDLPGDTDEEKLEYLRKLLEKSGLDENVQINPAYSVLGDVKNDIGESRNQADKSGCGHPNKVSSYTNAKVVAEMISDVLGLEMDYDYNGEIPSTYYVLDGTYATTQKARNNFKDDTQVPGSTDSGTNDRTNNYEIIADDEMQLIDEIVKGYACNSYKTETTEISTYELF